MSMEENKALVRRSMALVNARDIPALEALHIEDYQHHDPAFPGGGTRGFAEYAAAFGGFLTGFPDLHVTVDGVVAEGDRVAMRWHWTGTHTGPLNDLPPTGQSVRVNACSIHRITGGKLAEGWVVFDFAGMMQQLTPAPAPATAVGG